MKRMEDRKHIVRARERAEEWLKPWLGLSDKPKTYNLALLNTLNHFCKTKDGKYNICYSQSAIAAFSKYKEYLENVTVHPTLGIVIVNGIVHKAEDTPASNKASTTKLTSTSKTSCKESHVDTVSTDTLSLLIASAKNAGAKKITIEF